MNRLTKRFTENNERYVCIDVCREKCIENNSFCIKCEPFANVLCKLSDYEDAEEKGLFFKMPCKPGDTVFVLFEETEEIKELKVSSIMIRKNHDSIRFTSGFFFTIWGKKWNEFFNKIIFLTKEAAEQALQKIQEENKNEKN